MGEIVSGNDIFEVERISNGDLAEITENMILDARDMGNKESKMSLPIAELSTLGAGVASLLPAFRTVTQTVTMDSAGLFRIINASDGALKVAKSGEFAWGALKSADGVSKMAKLQAVDGISGTSVATMPIDPATLMMAAALYSIEKQLGNIEEMEKQILSFLQIEKEAEIEADLTTLTNIIQKYKSSWDNELFVSNNHKMVEDIQRTARKNVISYQKAVQEVVKSKNLLVVNSTLEDLQKKFKYYRLALYTFAMAGFAEIMLSKNFKEEYISKTKSELEKMALEYRDLFSECSNHLEKMKSMTVETNLVKGLGAASTAVGNLIGKIPKVKDGQVDEFLIDSGAKLRKGADDSQKRLVESFAEISNPGIGVFTERMSDLIQIYNHTSEICFDKDNIYLIAG